MSQNEKSVRRENEKCKDEDFAPLNIMPFWHVNPEPIKSDVLEAFKDGRPNQQKITRLHHSHTEILL